MNSRKIILVAGLAVVLVVASFFAFNDGEEVNMSAVHSEQIPKPKQITVYVSGQVKNSAVVTLEDNGNLRLIDAVNLAGGLTEYADSENINLAEPLRDGQHIHIPSKEIIFQEIPVAVAVPNKVVGDVVNINTADVDELTKIRGVGPAIAGRIVEYRNTNGAFKSIDEIKKVRGIGAKTFEKMRDNISVGN